LWESQALIQNRAYVGRVAVLIKSARVYGYHDILEKLTMMPTSRVPFVAFAAHEGPSVAVGGNQITFKVGQDDSQGDLMIVEYTASGHFPGPTPHIHQYTDEAFHVLNGVLQVTVGPESLRLDAAAW
jgi:mannose-6-phosphate isomerase-like protein (cupin superfamily)